MADSAPVRTTIGALLVLVGLAALADQILDLDLVGSGWPLFVIVPGVVLLVAGLTSDDGSAGAAAIAGAIVTTVGLLLLYQNATGHWESWAYAWTLVAPGSIGAVLWARARLRAGGEPRSGTAAMRVALVLFLVGFGFFEGILGISDLELGRAGEAVLPAVLILLGVLVLARRRRPGGG